MRGSGPTHRRPALALALLALSAAPASSGAQTAIKLPDFGDSSEAIFSSADDARLGEAFMREVRASVEVIDDPEVEDYIQALGYRLTSAGGARDRAFYFFVVNDGAVNAFAGPGGFIGIHSGLFHVTESESELASVVAHEAAHVTQRHIARAYENANRNNIPALAGVIAAIALGALSGSPDAGVAAASAITGLQTQNQIDLIRANEKEADRVGMQFLAESGFDPRAMPAFFEKLQTSSRFYRAPPEFLSTHPVTSSRIADSRARAETFPYRQTPGSIEYHLAAAKLRVLTARSPQTALDHFETTVTSGNHRNADAAAYGWALSLTAVRRFDQARQVLEELVREHPGEIRFKNALAENAAASGDIASAIASYESAYARFPDNKALVLGYAGALLQARRGADALALLDGYARLYGREARIYKLEAEGFAQVGQAVDSRLAMTEHFYLSGRLDAAINQLRDASAQAGQDDFYNSSRVAARLKTLEEERILRARR